MRRWKLIVCLALGVLYLIGCDQQAGVEPIELVDDSPVIGAWYLQQTAEDKPVPEGTTVRFDFKPHGVATYERAEGGVEPVRFDLTYNLADGIISIDSNNADPAVPRITGKIELNEGLQTLRISTHTEAQWLLTREQAEGEDMAAAPAGQSEAEGARRVGDPLAERVGRVAEGCRQYAERFGIAPEAMMDLVLSGVLEAGELTLRGDAAGLPERFKSMEEPQQEAWLRAHSPFVLFFEYAGTGQASSVLVSTLPVNGRADVVVGMADGAVYRKPALEVAQLLQFQLGHRPGRWPASAWPLEATVGLEPQTD